MASEIIVLNELGDAASDGVPDGQPDMEPAEGRSREEEAGEASASPDMDGPVKTAQTQDFPYFEFFAYGYLY